MRFLGMACYYRKFCNNFSVIAELLTNLRSKRMRFKWTSDCQNAFDKLKTLYWITLIFYSFCTLILNSGTSNCGIRNCYSKDLFYKSLWIISEGLCDINLKGTVYLHSFLLNLVLFFIIKYC